MSNRAAIVTGASRGIGRALAEVLASEGYDLTITARKPTALEEAAQDLRGMGASVELVTGDLTNEVVIQEVVRRHRARFGRLDVLVNSAGVGVAADAGHDVTKLIDLQLDLNLRAVILFYRETLEMLKSTGEEHGNALVVNMSSMAGRTASAGLSVYGASKAAVIAYTRAVNQELNSAGVKSVAFCPGFVDTDMTEFIRGRIPQQEMLRTSDIAEALRYLLRVSPACVIPEIVFARSGELI